MELAQRGELTARQEAADVHEQLQGMGQGYERQVGPRAVRLAIERAERVCDLVAENHCVGYQSEGPRRSSAGGGNWERKLGPSAAVRITSGWLQPGFGFSVIWR